MHKRFVTRIAVRFLYSEEQLVSYNMVVLRWLKTKNKTIPTTVRVKLSHKLHSLDDGIVILIDTTGMLNIFIFLFLFHSTNNDISERRSSIESIKVGSIVDILSIDERHQLVDSTTMHPGTIHVLETILS